MLEILMLVRDAFVLIGAFFTGLVLGGIFFGGLWLTINRMLSSQALGLWLAGSFILRMTIVLVGFYFVFEGHWQRLIACLFGFALARFIVARTLQDRGLGQTRPDSDPSHAS